MKYMAGIAVVLLLSNTVSAASYGVDPVFCNALTKHIPSADMAYQPGVDVHGKKVVPADLSSNSNVKIDQPITIPLTADLFNVLGLKTDSFPFNNMNRTDINLGVLTVDGDRVLYNGQPLSNEQQDNLAVLCMQPDKQKPVGLVPSGK